MSRQTALSVLVTMLKAQVGDSVTVGTQQDAIYKQLLSDKQQWLAGEFNFPFLKDRWNVTITPTTRYYTFPTTTIDGTLNIAIEFERPVATYVNWTANWIPVDYGIDEIEEMNSLNPDTNFPNWSQQANDPVQRWQFNGEGGFEVWPIPVTQQIFRFVGQRVLSALTAPTDTADLDDQLIVLSVAVDLLARSKKPAAPALLSSAQERLRALRAVYPCRTREVVLGGRGYKDRNWYRRVPIITIR